LASRKRRRSRTRRRRRRRGRPRKPQVQKKRRLEAMRWILRHYLLLQSCSCRPSLASGL
jgi:hypothetical protein